MPAITVMISTTTISSIRVKPSDQALRDGALRGLRPAAGVPGGRVLRANIANPLSARVMPAPRSKATSISHVISRWTHPDDE
jgi:hypothetical protein